MVYLVVLRGLESGCLHRRGGPGSTAQLLWCTYRWTFPFLHTCTARILNYVEWAGLKPTCGCFAQRDPLPINIKNSARSINQFISLWADISRMHIKCRTTTVLLFTALFVATKVVVSRAQCPSGCICTPSNGLVYCRGVGIPRNVPVDLVRRL